VSALGGRAAGVFDLDNTLYPASLTVYDAIGERMTAYIARLTGLDAPAALKLRERYFLTYGATVVGLARHHGCDADDFMRDVHDVDLSEIAADPDLARLLAALPARLFVFTNGAHAYARRVLERLGIAHLFERVVALEDIDFVPKPDARAFDLMISHARIDPERAVMVEDHARNLAPAAALGFATVLVGREAEAPQPEHVHHRLHDVRAAINAGLSHARLAPERARD
jgi:putative hydrolase of the HAD superfamily